MRASSVSVWRSIKIDWVVSPHPVKVASSSLLRSASKRALQPQKDIDLRVANLPQVLDDVGGAMLRWMALTGGGASITERVRKAYEKSEEVGR
jgi:hypothetical protein